VRKQLDSVDRAIEAEATKATPDGQRLNWLAQAQERLAEQERILDNRPLPGSRRPKGNAPAIHTPCARIIGTADEDLAPPVEGLPPPKQSDAVSEVGSQDSETKWEMRETRPGVYEQVITDSPALRAERARQAQLAGSGPSQSSRPSTSDAVEPSPAAEAKLARADAVPAPVPQAGGVVGYGYELAPGGVWKEANSPAPQPDGLIAAAEAAARARQSWRRR
jgi:hypothetical protein